MKWKQIGSIPEQKPTKDGWIVKAQYDGNILVLDIYTDREWEARYCIDPVSYTHLSKGFRCFFAVFKVTDFGEFEWF